MTGYLGELPPLRIIQLTGSVGSDLAISPLEIMRRAVQRSGGVAEPIFVPILADSVEAAETIRRQPEIRRTLESFRELTAACVSVGSWSPATSQLITYLSPIERAELERVGVVGEVAGTFLNAAGEGLEVPFTKRMIRIQADELRPVGQKIVVADGVAKAATVLAAVKADLANVLIVDSVLAEELLVLAEDLR